MFRGANERRISCIRRTLTNPEYILLLAVVVLGVLSSNISPSSSLVLDQHSRIEGFIANNRSTKRIHRRPGGYCFSIPLFTRLAPSSSVFISSMSYSYNDDQSNRSNDHGKSHSGKRQEQGKRKDPQRREATANAAPLYITIGPQCCGKSSFLRNYKNGTIKDISLDDQRDVYVPIPTETFLQAYGDSNGAAETTNNQQDQLLQRVYQGKTLKERIRENVELVLILRRWNGDSTASDFERGVKHHYAERGFPETVATALIRAVEDFLSNEPDLPRDTDVFILESLFKPHPQSRQSAIQKAHEEIRATPRHIPVSWGNTNSKARDYGQVLEICHRSRRPVRFILCHPAYGSDTGAGNAPKESELMTLPWVPLEKLLKRNLHRLQTQGRFIPANAIADCCQRVTAMIPADVQKTASEKTNDKLLIEEHLVAIASPSNGVRNPPRRDNRRPGPTFRYSLSKNRFIQKEYPRNEARRPPPNQPNRNYRRYDDQRGSRRGNQSRHNDRSQLKRKYDGNDTDRDNLNQRR